MSTKTSNHTPDTKQDIPTATGVSDPHVAPSSEHESTNEPTRHAATQFFIDIGLSILHGLFRLFVTVAIVGLLVGGFVLFMTSNPDAITAMLSFVNEKFLDLIHIF